MAAPAYPPIKAWEDEVGSPHHQVRRSQTIAPNKRGHHDILIHVLQTDHAAADCVGHSGTEEKSGEKIESGRPKDSESRG